MLCATQICLFSQRLILHEPKIFSVEFLKYIMLGVERGRFFRVVLVVCLFGLDSPSPIPLSMLQIIPQFNDQNNKQYYVSYVLWVRKSWLGSWAVLRMLSLPGTCPGLQDLLPRWRTPMVGRTMPVVDGRPQSLCRWAFPQHCPGILT